MRSVNGSRIAMMNYYKSKINIRIITKDNKIQEYTDVEEYVQGRFYFYAHLKTGQVVTTPRETLKQVFRFIDSREWPINLKKRFTEDED
jgi:hypothetical protein